jgi:hypothetical protein
MMRPRSYFVLAAMLGALDFLGCAAWHSLADAAGPVAAAACDLFETRACATHTAAGLLETDARSIAAHAAGRAADAAQGAALGPALSTLGAALQAITGPAGAR